MTLTDFANGDVNYVATLNSNNATLVSNINSLIALLGGSSTAPASFSILLGALFGNTIPVTIGASSYSYVLSGTQITVGSGAVWKPSSQAIVGISTSTVLDFAGQLAGTYYIVPDAGGTPAIQSSGADAIYSVVWSGSGISSVTLLASSYLSAAEQAGVLNSTRYGAYTTLEARLNHIESLL